MVLVCDDVLSSVIIVVVILVAHSAVGVVLVELTMFSFIGLDFRCGVKPAVLDRLCEHPLLPFIFCSFSLLWVKILGDLALL